MAKKTIGIGTTPNDGTGDSLRVGMGKANDNFDELYAAEALNTAKVTNATHSGDASGATTLTLATVNTNVGTYTNATVTVNAKGLVTAAASASDQYRIYTDGVTQMRIGVRSLAFVIDIALTATAFAGSENTDWKNIMSFAND